MRARVRHFARKVARENSSNDSVPSWFASSWSKILRAWLSSAPLAPLADCVVPRVSLDVPFVPLEGVGDDEAGVDDGLGVEDGLAVDEGVVVAVDVLDDGVDVAVAELEDVVDCGVASASVELRGIAFEAVVSAVVADAAPARVMIEAATAIPSFVCMEFIGTPFNDDVRSHERRAAASANRPRSVKRGRSPARRATPSTKCLRRKRQGGRTRAAMRVRCKEPAAATR